MHEGSRRLAREIVLSAWWYGGRRCDSVRPHLGVGALSFQKGIVAEDLPRSELGDALGDNGQGLLFLEWAESLGGDSGGVQK